MVCMMCMKKMLFLKQICKISTCKNRGTWKKAFSGNRVEGEAQEKREVGCFLRLGILRLSTEERPSKLVHPALQPAAGFDRNPRVVQTPKGGYPLLKAHTPSVCQTLAG